VGEEGVGDVHDAVDRDAERRVVAFAAVTAAALVMVRVPLSVSVTLGLKTMVDPAANVSAAPEATVKLPVKEVSLIRRGAIGARVKVPEARLPRGG